MLFRKSHPSMTESIVLSEDEEAEALLSITLDGFKKLSEKCDDLILRIKARRNKADTGAPDGRQHSQH